MRKNRSELKQLVVFDSVFRVLRLMHKSTANVNIIVRPLRPSKEVSAQTTSTLGICFSLINAICNRHCNMYLVDMSWSIVGTIWR